MCLPRHTSISSYYSSCRANPAVPHTPNNTSKGALYDSFMGAVQNVAVRMESCMDA